MKTIWKYEFKTTDYICLNVPMGSEILTVQTQDNIPCIWFLVETKNELIEKSFRIYGTGHPFDEDTEQIYIGTYQLYNGKLIFHVFEIIK